MIVLVSHDNAKRVEGLEEKNPRAVFLANATLSLLDLDAALMPCF